MQYITENDYNKLKKFVYEQFEADKSITKNVSIQKNKSLLKNLLKQHFDEDIAVLSKFIENNSTVENFAEVNATVILTISTRIFIEEESESLDIERYVRDNLHYNDATIIDDEFSDIDASLEQKIVMNVYSNVTFD